MKRSVSILLIFSLLLSFSSCIRIEKIEPPRAEGVAPSLADDPESTVAGGGGHTHLYYSENGDSIKLCKCAFDGCDSYGRYVEEDALDETLNEYFNYEDKKKEIVRFCGKFLRELEKVDEYDPDLHSFSEESPLFEESRDAVSKMEKLEEYSDLITDISDVVYLYYVSDMEKYEDKYNDADDFSLAFQQKYYEIELAGYDSAYREYIFRADDGWTKEALDDEMELAKTNVDEKLIELSEAISELSMEVDRLEDPMYSDETPEYMARVVEANNAYAKYYGYDNYYEYAMENVYGRDYTADDVNAFTSYVKKYIMPLLWIYQARFISGWNVSESDPAYSVCGGSIIGDRVACDAVYGFLKKVEACQSGGESYYDSANDAFREGRVKMIGSDGDFMTAFTYYLGGLGMPLMCLSDDYVGVSTFVHEHGHYYAYLTDSSDQVSLDVNETQSQGAEMLFAYYLDEFFKENGYEGYSAAKAYILYTNITSLVDCCCSNEFEKVLYTGDVAGIEDPEGRLADGVTSDEYDYLYDCILSGYNIAPGYDRYWRITVPAHPCYYLSYAVSLVPSLEIYTLSCERGFEAGAAAYLSLFDYQNTDEFENRDVSDVEYMCRHIGVGSPFDERSFIALSEALK
jgi:hypothetical protein